MQTMSIRRKLFYLVGGLLIVVTGFYLWFAYREVRSSAILATAARLEGIADQWASMLATQRQQQLAITRRNRDSSVIRQLMAPATVSDSATLAQLRALFRTETQRTSIQVLSAEPRTLASTSEIAELKDPTRYADYLRKAAISDSGVITPFFAVGDSIYYGSIVRIVDDGKLRGYIVEWRRLGSAPARDQLNRLFGGGSTTLLLANTAGDVWTDLSGPVAAPNVDLTRAGPVLAYTRPNADPVVAVARPVTGTPWAIVMESSRSEAVSQARRFLARAWPFGMLLVALGLLLTAGLSVSLTGPLARLTHAADAVAAGDYSQKTRLSERRDEVGRLTAAFDAMVDRVQVSFAARRASEERYRLLFESVPLPQWVFDRETWRILAVNQAAIEHYGYSRDEFLAMTIADVSPPEDVSRVREAIAKLDGAITEGDAWRHVKKDGTLIEVETSGHSFEFDGRPARIAIMHDVTERNRAANALRRSEEKYRRVVSEFPIGVTSATLEGRFTVVNPAFVEMLGYDSEDQLLELNARDLVANQEQWATLLVRFQEGSLVKREEIQLVRRDGTLIVTQFTGRLLTDGLTGAQHVEAAWEDVTTQRRIERQFQQAQKMEAIGQLAGGIAHDFNNLLTIIISSSDLLLADTRVHGAFRSDIESIRSAGQSAAGLTRQLLAFSRKQVLQPRVLQPNELVMSTTAMLKRLIGENIELMTVLAADAGSVKVDPGQLEQVIVNLAVNARDAMPNGGRLLIESKNVEFAEPLWENKALYPAGRYVALTVTDTGIGMDSETQARVFEPFFTTKEAGEGTGLGLATVYGIVRQSGGFISVYSEPGAGATFKIYFPRVDESAQALDPAAGDIEPLRGRETILVVEDSPTVRAIMRRVLSGLGYRVIEAHDGESAVALSSTHEGPIHMLLTDVVMPRMGGRTVAERISKERPGIRVLFVSGYTDDAIVRHGVLEPGVHYLEKPFTPDALAKKVRHVLDTAGAYVAT